MRLPNPLSLYKRDDLVDSRLKDVLENVKDRVAKMGVYFGVSPYVAKSAFSRLEIEKKNLPREKIYVITRIGDYLIGRVEVVRKVLGRFVAPNKIYLDKDLLYSKFLFAKVLAHELVHKLQELSGRLYRLPKYLLELEADMLSSIALYS